MSVILVDMDGVLADFERGFLTAWRRDFPGEKYILLEERNTFYVHHQYGEELEPKVRQVMSAPGFFREFPPIKDGIQTVQELVKRGHEVFVCTAPLSGTPTCLQEKYDWIMAHLGGSFARTMVIASDKTMVRGDYLIDDRPEVQGRFKPEWEHILFHAPYNASVINRRRLESWAEGINLFGKV